MLNILNLKKITKAILISVISVTFFLGCASNIPMATHSEDSIAKSFKKDRKYANVYLCRNSFEGSALNKTVLVDGKFVGHTSGYSFFHWKMKPGKHTIVSKTKNISSLTLNTKSNTNYFIIQGPNKGGFKVETNLYLVDEEEGKKCVLATKMLKSQPHVSGYPQKAYKIKPTYVSPVKYEKYSCKKLRSEIEKTSQRATLALAQLENINARNTAMVLSLTPLIVLPTVLSSTSETEVELGKLNGEYNALKTVSRQKKCNFASTLQ